MMRYSHMGLTAPPALAVALPQAAESGQVWAPTTWAGCTAVLATLWVLNLIDGAATLLWVRLGVAAEANPLMATWLALGDAPFLTVKLLAGTVAVYTLYNLKETAVARYGLPLLLAVYTATASVHALWAARLWG